MKLRLCIIILNLSLLASCSHLSDKAFHEDINVKVISNSIIIPVQIEDKTYNFQLDTGAPCSITPDLFNALKLKVNDSILSVDYYGNKRYLSETNLPEFKLNNSKFKDLKVGIHKQIQHFSSFGIKIDGTLGGNFFNNKIVQIDTRKRQVIISNDPLKLNLEHQKSTSIKLEGEQNMILIPIKFPGKGANEIVNFDTGSNNFLYRLNKKVYVNMMQDKILKNNDLLYNSFQKGRGVFGSQKDSINHVVHFDSIKIGNTLFLNATATTFESDFTNSILGAPLLKLGTVTIDYAEEKFYFTPYQNGVIDLKPEHGCYMDYINGQFKVEYIIPGSIADRKGVKKGYILKRFNSIVYDSLSKKELVNLSNANFREHNNVYVFRRDSDEKEIKIVVKRTTANNI